MPGYGASRSVDTDAGLRAHMLGVFRNMGLGLVITGLVAALVGNTPALAAAIYGTPLKWVAIFAPLAFVFYFSFRIEKMTTSGARMAFYAFAAVMGVSLGSVFLVFTGGSIAHIGQFFFDQALIDKVSQTYPYTQNPYVPIGNALDDTFHQETAYSASDPVFHYEYLGDTLADGLFMWVRVGVNASASWPSEQSFVYGADGGKYSCGTGRIGANYTSDDENCQNDVNVGALPGEKGPGPAVDSAPPPTQWDNETDAAEISAAHSVLQGENSPTTAV